ncbi:MAG: circadian clock protein KaiC [Sporichthyaceae bacterium]
MAPGTAELERIDAGIPGLDLVTYGGLPRNRLTLIAGTAGSGKTVFLCQFLAGGIRNDEPGVFVTFEERPEGIRRNMRSFGWDIPAWEQDGKWVFVDASPRHTDTYFSGDDYDLTPLLSRIVHAIERIGATRVAIDSIGSLVSQFDHVAPARRALFRLAETMEKAGATAVISTERGDDYGPIGRLGFEEFVADNVMILRNSLASEKRRRSLEVLKMRGCSHMRGEHLFTLLQDGIAIVPVAISSIGYGTSTTRMSCGLPALDEMLHGGLYEKSLWLVAGPTGTGKSFLSTHFVAGGVAAGQRALLHSFEESRPQLLRNAAAWGLDLEAMEHSGRLCIIADAPEAASLEDHLHRMKTTIEKFAPDRVAIDSLTALQRISTVKSFREYVLGMTYHIKLQAMAGLVTSSVTDFLTADGTGELHVSTISDAITLLHYVPVGGEMRRGLQVLKLRGSDHDKHIREYRITGNGIELLDPFDDIAGLF